MSTEEEARREAEQAAAADERLSKLAEKIGGAASARAVFGEPVERDGVTVIPVARVRYGFGAGSGRGPGRHQVNEGNGSDETAGEEQYGSGGGGGVQAAPIGYIELHGGEAHFKRIANPARMVALIAIPAAAAAVAGVVWRSRAA